MLLDDSLGIVEGQARCLHRFQRISSTKKSVHFPTPIHPRAQGHAVELSYCCLSLPLNPRLPFASPDLVKDWAGCLHHFQRIRATEISVHFPLEFFGYFHFFLEIFVGQRANLKGAYYTA
jgi:hypothetical protein